LKLSGYVLNCMVYGDNKLYNTALITANMPDVEKWAAQHGLSEKGDALLATDKVQALFRDEIDKHSSDFKQFEKIKKFKLIAEDFTVDNGMLTPKMSLKRRVVMAKYGAALNALY
jgi:long-chain acyl-CoA synthetase